MVSDLLIRNIPRKERMAPEVLLLSGRLDLVADNIRYLDLSVDSDLILEMVSETTYEADAVIKYDIYRLAGIGEYWLYNPNGVAKEPSLQGWQLKDPEYKPVQGRTGTMAGKKTTVYPSAVLETDWRLKRFCICGFRNNMTGIK